MALALAGSVLTVLVSGVPAGAVPVVGLRTGAPPASARSTTAARAVAGAQTAGDSLFPDLGNGGYDVRHYAVALKYSPTSRKIAATTTIIARAARPLSSFSLDFEGLSVSSVRVNGRVAAYTRHGHKLVITPLRPVLGRFTTKVTYGGRPITHIDPDGSKDGWVPSPDGATALNEPLGAMTWFPNNNTPRDKATFTMAITVPRALSVAGNGDLASRRHHDGWTTWTWRQRRQMATYLAMISIGRYRVYTSTMTTAAGRSLPVWTFVEPKLGSLSAQRRLLPQIVRWQERRFGRYPFTSVGMVVRDLKVGYSLETQNRPFFDGVPDTLLMVHELSHMWFGDSVTPRDWQDIWLNEGFATYAEALWDEGHGGPRATVAFHKAYRDNPASSSLWRPAPAAFSDPADLFGDPVYTRGGMTLEALRERIGTANFMTILRRWASRHAQATVSTAEFIRLAEQVSGQSLGSLFHPWLYVAARPDRF